MTVFLIGGAKSGKSDLAQQIALQLADGGAHYYWATMMPTSSDADQAVIRSHLDRRAGMGFETIECGRKILTALNRVDPSGTVLLDAVTTLLNNELYDAEQDYQINEAAAVRCGDDLLQLLQSVQHVVLVSDDLFRDAVRFDPAMDAYRRHLGNIHRRLAAACDVVLEMVSGNLISHKGGWPL